MGGCSEEDLQIPSAAGSPAALYDLRMEGSPLPTPCGGSKDPCYMLTGFLHSKHWESSEHTSERYCKQPQLHQFGQLICFTCVNTNNVELQRQSVFDTEFENMQRRAGAQSPLPYNPPDPGSEAGGYDKSLVGQAKTRDEVWGRT